MKTNFGFHKFVVATGLILAPIFAQAGVLDFSQWVGQYDLVETVSGEPCAPVLMIVQEDFSTQRAKHSLIVEGHYLENRNRQDRFRFSPIWAVPLLHVNVGVVYEYPNQLDPLARAYGVPDYRFETLVGNRLSAVHKLWEPSNGRSPWPFPISYSLDVVTHFNAELNGNTLELARKVSDFKKGIPHHEGDIDQQCRYEKTPPAASSL